MKLLVAAAATVLASSVMAQSAFEGFYGQIATGYENNTIQNTNLVVGPNSDRSHTGGTLSGGGTATSGSAPLILGLGYTFSLAPKFTLGLGADYSALSQTTNTATYNFGGGCSDPNGGCAQVKYKISNRYNIFVTPGFAIDKDKLAYLKVGYSGVTAQAQPQNGVANSFSTNLSGYVVGLGYKQIISGGFYGFGEANYYGYSKASFNGTSPNTDGTPSQPISLNPGVNAYNFLVGVGYKF